ncbi:MAG: 2-dehydropantoate 2-reductase N-terminal domain-containing protein [Bacteroidota bacterium]|nr:2-dehydropantoate 2-reductase N-terminal domain-containing protein [Bacteroidota bacterium]
MAKAQIIIAGIGGVGGYFGGLLAKHYHDSKNVEIFFLARGQHLEEIKKSGLKVIKGDVEFIAKPTLATNNPSEIGIADLVIITTKTFDLETIIQQLQPCISQDTIILPLLHGVDSKQRIEKNTYWKFGFRGLCLYRFSP